MRNTLLIFCLVLFLSFCACEQGGDVASITTAVAETAVTTVDTAAETTIAQTIAPVEPSFAYEVATLNINTDGGVAITSKEEYVHGVLTLGEKTYAMKIRGRGNASWNQFPKKSYRIKLDEGASLFGMPQNRDFVLSSNYADKTLIRNCVAHNVAKSLSGLAYTPTHIPVDLYINGEYLGVYTFADKIEDGSGRLSLGETVLSDTGEADIGFLLEIGWDYDSENVYNRDYFDTNVLYRIYVKEPEITKVNSPEFRYVKKYVLDTEKAITSDSGWENYIDVDSFIDWLIVNEFTFNTESSFYRSCYLWKAEGGKLCLGPVWDFDMAFGNHKGDIKNYDGWCTTEATYSYVSENWISYLMRYDSFTDRFKARWNEVKHTLLQEALATVDGYSAALDGYQQRNFEKWDIMDKQIGLGNVNPKEYNTYDGQVEYLRNFINTRWNYIDSRINSEF